MAAPRSSRSGCIDTFGIGARRDRLWMSHADAGRRPVNLQGISAYQNNFVNSLINYLTSELQHNSVAKRPFDWTSATASADRRGNCLLAEPGVDLTCTFGALTGALRRHPSVENR
jgi:hypothetical protein